MKLGTNTISTVKLGSNQVNAVYLGSNLVWQNAPVATAATGIGQTSFTANWDAFTGAVYYLLDVSESSDFSTFVYENQITTSTSYVVIGLDSNTTYYYRVRASTSYDADAQAFFDRVDTDGGTLSTTEKTAVNTLVLQMKDYGIWTKMKAIYPMVGASAAACAQNLKSSSFTGTFTSGWTFASTGITPNGTSAYMTTSLIPSTEFSTVNDGNFGYYHRTSLKVYSTVMGTKNLGYYFMDWIASAGQSYPSINDGNSAPLTYASNIKGFRQISRNSSNVNQILYKLNTTDYSVTQAPTGRPTIQIYVGSSGTSFYSDSEIAFVYIGDTSLTTTEQSNFYTAVQAFQTTLSRQV